MTTPTTTTQEAALESIRQEVAEYGKPTPRALRLRINFNLTIDAYKQAIREGLARYDGDDPRTDWEVR